MNISNNVIVMLKIHVTQKLTLGKLTPDNLVGNVAFIFTLNADK